ncbi:MAG: DUF3078 domain-containing protein [Bacteroidetes bacterium]|nr:DUF3078 domain-containing protein [Bacteroidota bacterium]MBT4728145.1 DUF3078 domain-containing protein [Bacteroidota bacterium]MBT4967504.1 DUF3078 domain-containing protein [Bacteroidota bacterium]MBT7039033.1 DUF3078 domain-containing protein [Bacteroidota bacterium]MBT7828275.1 DUF3078 domain-containing protein [Bacteroidota bacterium]
MKKVILLIMTLFCFSLMQAQDAVDSTKKWKKGGSGSLMVNQLTLTNWAAGGENSISVNGMFNLFANYKKDRTSWDNTLDIAYGLIKQGETDLRKADDRIELTSKYGQYAFKHWYYSGFLSFKTQMNDGFKYPNDSVRISSLFAPAYLTAAIGMDFKPNDNFSLLISPLTGKTTFVMAQELANAGKFGVTPAVLDVGGNIITPGQTIRFEFGAYVKFIYKKDLGKNINLLTKLDLFTNYLENPEKVDVNWEVLMAMKINKYISVNINTLLIWDQDVLFDIENSTDKEPRVQFKELFGVGFSYKF